MPESDAEKRTPHWESPAEPPLPWGQWWALSAGWWLLSAVLSGLARASMTGGSPTGVSVADLVSFALWIPITVFALWLATRYPLHRDSWWRTVPIAVAAAVGVVVLRALVVLVSNDLMHWYPVLPPFTQILMTSAANNLLLFPLVLGAAHAVAYARAARVREELLAQAELANLKAQLHPHFLFNALNAVSAYVRTDPDVAAQVIARLGTLLRHALQHADTQEVSLAEELGIVAAYLDIEQVRFGDRLQVRWRVDPELLGGAVPHLLLQPLVENAIRHGLSGRSAPGTIEIHAAREGDTLRLTVRDDGDGLSATAAQRPGNSTGVGLANVRQRLRQLYGPAQQFDLRSAHPRGVEVTVAMPFRLHARRGNPSSPLPAFAS